MRFVLFAAPVLAVLVAGPGDAAGVGPVGATAGVGPKHDLTVGAIVESRRLLDLLASPNLQVSPDGRRYLLSLTRGDLRRGGNWLELVSGSLDSLQGALHPKTIRLFTTAKQNSDDGELPPIQPADNKISWLKDSRRVVMAWNDGRSPTQVVAVNVVTGRVRRLTHHKTSIYTFGVSGDGESIVFNAYPPPAGDPTLALQRGVTVEKVEAPSLLIEGPAEGAERWKALQTYVQTAAVPAPRELDRNGLVNSYEWLSNFSPDGRYVVTPRQWLGRFPSAWEGYRSDELKTQLAKLGPNGLHRIGLYDLKSATLRTLWDAPNPVGPAPTILWEPDSRRVIVGPTFTPIAHASEAGLTGRALAEVDVATGQFREIDLPDGKAAYRPVRIEGGVLTVSDGAKDIRFVRADGAWRPDTRPRQDPPSAAAPSPVRVELRQDMNTPPALYAVERSSGSAAKVLDVDGSLATAELARVDMVHWDGSDGYHWTGRLYYPTRYVPTHRYPLVIQTHGYAPADEFSLLGAGDQFGTVDAAQALAARGVVVLQMGDLTGGQDGRLLPGQVSPQEPVTYMRGYEGAVAHFEALGFIDRSRVGISGFSRTGWHVEYALTHSDVPFAAAIAADNITVSYVEAALLGRSSGEYATDLGGRPYGPGLRWWLQNAPGFNADRIRTPLRLETDNGGVPQALTHWEMFSRLKDLGLPVELYIAPDSAHSSHPLQNATQRLASEGGAVDWFDFWLNDHEDPAPEKAKQYERWRALKAQRDASRNLPRPPLLTWTSAPMVAGEAGK